MLLLFITLIRFKNSIHSNKRICESFYMFKFRNLLMKIWKDLLL